MDKGLALELGRTIVGVIDKEFAEQEGLAAQALRGGVPAEEVRHLVAKDGDTTWLQADDWRAGFNVTAQRSESLLQRGPRLIEHAEVIKRTAAAERGWGNPYLIAGVLQYFARCFGDCRIEVVAEGVRPKNDLWTALVAQLALTEPAYK